MRVAVYARYSTEKQNDGYSIEAQLEACQRRLAADGWSYDIHEYIDRAKSGTTIAGRTALMRLIGDAAKGALDKVMVYKFDRLGRNQAETATLVQDLEEAGVQVVSATEGDDPLARGMHLVFAEHYRRQLAERTLRGNIKAAEGGRIGGVAPYGYRRRDDGELEPDPEQVDLVRRIFRDYVEGGSFKGIARELNTEGVPTERGGEWHASTVSDILQNEAYVGRLIFNQRTFYRDRKTGRRRYRWNPEDDWIILERPELAIVSKELFAKADQRRAKRRRKGPETHRTYALSGIVQCAECGNAYIAQASANKKGRYVYMTCGNRASGGTCTNRFRFREDIVREELATRLDEVLLSETATDALKKTIKRLVLAQLEGRDAHLEAIEEQRRDCRRRMDAVKKLMVDAVTRGDGTDEVWHEEMAKLKESLDALAEREKELRIGPRLDFSELNRIVDEAVAEQREGLLEVEDAEKVRDALRVLVGRLEAHRDGRLVYKANPVSLLEADGESRVGLVAGAGFEPATFRL